MDVLILDHVTKKFGGLSAVSDLTLHLKKGSLHGLIGPNGAGKTTVFNLITGIYTPTSGSIRLEDKEISGLQPHVITKLGCARTFQNLRLFKKQTVLDNIRIAAQLHDTTYNYVDAIFKTPKYRKQEAKIKEKAYELLKAVGLKGKELELATNLPYGLQRKMEIARALATNPKVLLLDEPAAGMNPEESDELMHMIRNIRDRFDVTILLIEHHMDLVMGICEEITVLNFGATIAVGTPSEIQTNQGVIEAYLGVEVEVE